MFEDIQFKWMKAAQGKKVKNIKNPFSRIFIIFQFVSVRS
jgi:hypothetical protein